MEDYLLKTLRNYEEIVNYEDYAFFRAEGMHIKDS